MQYRITITNRARKDILGLPRHTAERIVKKLRFFSSAPDPLRYAKPLTNTEVAQYRFRIGDHRILFDTDVRGNIIILVVLTIQHRKDVYRGV